MESMILLVRDGQLCRLSHDSFWNWARAGGVRRTDMLRGTDGVWRWASSYAEISPLLQRPRPTLGESLLMLGAGLTLSLAVFKLVQAAVDEDFGGRHFPEHFRHELIARHLDRHGATCPRCRERVRVRDFSVDHVVPWARGGRTSAQNAQVLCRYCNSRKRDTVGLLDHIRGRGS